MAEPDLLGWQGDLRAAGGLVGQGKESSGQETQYMLRSWGKDEPGQYSRNRKL